MLTDGAAASLSRNLWQSDTSPGIPPLLHSLRELRSVLSLAASDLYIFCGSQGQDIPVRWLPRWQRGRCADDHNAKVWDKKTFRLKDNLRGHTGSVLALAYAEDRKWLFSSSGDSTVRVRNSFVQCMFCISFSTRFGQRPL
jgi:di- and tripeptidase